MRIQPSHSCLALVIMGLTACTAALPVSAPPGPSEANFEPAPLPHVHYRRSGGTAGSLEIPIPPKMPPGTGAVPVSNSPFRGSVVTGLRQSF